MSEGREIKGEKISGDGGLVWLEEENDMRWGILKFSGNKRGGEGNKRSRGVASLCMRRSKRVRSCHVRSARGAAGQRTRAQNVDDK